jgi:hypothetical protein
VTRKSLAADFLANMKQEPIEVAQSSVIDKKLQEEERAQPSSRAGLKHFGGYVHQNTVEKVAILRARLDLDNSELITRAIDELFSKHKAQRAFSD